MLIVVIVLRHVARRAHLANNALIEPDRRLAQLRHLIGAVADEQDGGATGADFTNALEALGDEIAITGRQRFIDDQYVGINADRGRKRQPRLHAR